MSHCVISANAGRLQLNVIQALMSGTCGPGIPAEIDSRSAANSVCLGACHGGTQVGFLRVATDRATFAYLADAIVHEQPHGRGIAKRMRETMRSHPDLQGVRRFHLSTRDAHGLYARFGFAPVDAPDRLMEIRRICTISKGTWATTTYRETLAHGLSISDNCGLSREVGFQVA
jgi:GNAT superfamily N-acetyltransferase